jgi:SulP family sulfate permease
MLPRLFKLLKVRKKQQVLTKEQCTKDIVAGVIVGIIALPLSVALAISSGATPEIGLITAIIAGLCISIFGGSSVQIGGPTGAFVVIVYGIIKQHGLSGLVLATFMAGALLVILGLLKMGTLITYVPKTVVVGFTSGIGVTLLMAQMKDFLGLTIAHLPSEFLHKMASYLKNIQSINMQTLFIGILTIVLIKLTSKYSKIIPGSLCAILITTVIVQIMGIETPTIASAFGTISSKIPAPKLPIFSITKILSLLGPTFTIAFLAGVESLLSAVVADDMLQTEDKHDSNMELVAQGIANMASALFGGLPATGAIARTAANIKNGGRTPIAGIVHGMTLLMIMLLFMPLIQFIPLATLSGILIIVSLNMIEIEKMQELIHHSKQEMVIVLLTFILTVVFDLVIAVVCAMALQGIFVFVEQIKVKNQAHSPIEQHTIK